MSPYIRVALVIACLTTFLACDKTRETIHEMTADPATASADAAAPVVDASAAKTATSAAVDAGVDAGKAHAAAPAAKKRQRPPLNGSPAGAACVEGSSTCASGSECTGGKCTCYNGFTSCGGACLDLSRDPYNCDKCGHECADGQYCKWGHCE